MRVAFLGLGIMGQSMATNLVKAGHEVTVWNRTAGKQVEGARAAATPAEAAQGAEVVWMAVSDTAAVENVLFGPDGVEPSLTEGMIVVDSSTISPSATRKFAERVAHKGARYVDSPMTGSKAGAESGTLLFIVGGEEHAIERLKPLYAAMGKKIFRMGEVGKGQSAKLAMNLQIALIYEGFAEGPRPRRRQRSSRQTSRPRNRGGGLRIGHRRRPRRPRLRRHAAVAGKMGGRRSERASGMTPVL